MSKNSSLQPTRSPGSRDRANPKGKGFSRKKQDEHLQFLELFFEVGVGSYFSATPDDGMLIWTRAKLRLARFHCRRVGGRLLGPQWSRFLVNNTRAAWVCLLPPPAAIDEEQILEITLARIRCGNPPM